MTKKFENVTAHAKANVYFDGACVSHTLEFNDGTRKTLGVIQPGSYTFTTAAAEEMEVHAGSARVRLPGSEAWVTYGAGQSFVVPGDSAFDIEVTELFDYTCSYG